MNTAPFLSICIPTYNRAALLQQTLESIVSDPLFTDSHEIEVVVSDNCSTDDTPAVTARFAAAFPDKVRVFRQEEAITPDDNFGFVMKQGRGTYLKLLNDTFMVRAGALPEMLKVLRAVETEKPVVFFTNGSFRRDSVLEVLTSINQCQVLRAVEFKSPTAY